MCPLVVIIILLIILICLTGRRNNMASSPLEDVYTDMKTGDLLLIMNGNNKIKSLWMVYNDDNQTVGYVKENNGLLETRPIVELLKQHKRVKWMRLLEPLNESKLWKIQRSINSMYVNQTNIKINLVLIMDNKQRYFLECLLYYAKILFDIGVLKFDNPQCILDPTECIQQFYRNSTFITAINYYDVDDLITLT